MTFQSFTPREYLKIDIANNYGLDKSNWDERINWFDQNEPNLMEMVSSAEEPALFYAGVKAWQDVLNNKPIGYMISLDATSSGLQLLAALTSDHLAAKLCNVIDTGNREDAYTGIYQHICNSIGSNATINRDDTKQAIMTAFYSSKAVPKQVFGEGALLDVFYDILSTVAPAAWELNEAMLALWNPDALSHDWVLPDNFHVKVKVMNQVKERAHFANRPIDVFYKVNMSMEQVRSLGANTIHSIDGMIVRELTRRCDYKPHKIEYVSSLLTNGDKGGKQILSEDDKLVVKLWDHYKRTGYLSARILDHLNGKNIGHVDKSEISDLIGSLPKKPFKVISIHDCFRVLPTYGNDLRIQYNNQLRLISKSNLLGDLISQLVGRNVNIGKLDPNMHTQIMNANYALS